MRRNESKQSSPQITRINMDFFINRCIVTCRMDSPPWKGGVPVGGGGPPAQRWSKFSMQRVSINHPALKGTPPFQGGESLQHVSLGG